MLSNAHSLIVFISDQSLVIMLQFSPSFSLLHWLVVANKKIDWHIGSLISTRDTKEICFVWLRYFNLCDRFWSTYAHANWNISDSIMHFIVLLGILFCFICVPIFFCSAISFYSILILSAQFTLFFILFHFVLTCVFQAFIMLFEIMLSTAAVVCGCELIFIGSSCMKAE